MQRLYKYKLRQFVGWQQPNQKSWDMGKSNGRSGRETITFSCGAIKIRDRVINIKNGKTYHNTQIFVYSEYCTIPCDFSGQEIR